MRYLPSYPNAQGLLTEFLKIDGGLDMIYVGGVIGAEGDSIYTGDSPLVHRRRCALATRPTTSLFTTYMRQVGATTR